MQRSSHDIVVFTGAGISAPAGLRTYRGPNGMWNDAQIVRAAESATLRTDPALSWQHWGGLRAQINAAVPTKAHYALAQAEARLPEGYTLHIVTQNVDGLHASAGSNNVIEFHGNVMRTRCTNPRCTVAFDDHQAHLDTVPTCQACGSILRPDIVLFGEQIERNGSNKIAEAKALFRRAGVVIVVGTTLAVEPASKIVDIRKRSFAGVRTIWVNIEPPGRYPHCYQNRYIGSAEEALPRLMQELIPASQNA